MTKPNLNEGGHGALVVKELILENLGCANCAAKMEHKINKLQGVNSATINFASKILTMEIHSPGRAEDIIEAVREIVMDIEAGVVMREKNITPTYSKVLILKGLCCANCAAKIEGKVKKLDSVRTASVDLASQKLFLEADDIKEFSRLFEDIKAIVKAVEPDVDVYKEEDKNDKVHEQEENGLINREILQLLVGAILFIIPQVVDSSLYLKLPLFLASYVIIGGGVLLRAVKNIVKGQVFDENFLMSIATVGAFAIGQYPEGIAVMLFYKIGEIFQNMAVDRSRKSIASLMDIRPDYANLKTEDGVEMVSPEEVSIGSFIIVKPGERVPLDGRVVDGTSMVDTTALTGESVPRNVEPGEEVLSGFINKNGLLTVEVTKNFSQSTASKILDLVQNAGSRKSPTENFITRFARYYTPIVVISASLLAFIPPMFVGNLAQWVYRALVFLVVSCPCALVVSIPLGFFGGIGSASRNGILVKGGNYLEALNKVRTVVFDKTGTLTKGVFKVTEIVNSEGFEKEELLETAAYGESHSSHPIAVSILQVYGKKINEELVESYEEVSGKGTKTLVGGKTILAGNQKLMKDGNIDFQEVKSAGTTVHIAVDGVYAGYITISDEIKEDSRSAIERLRKLGMEKVIMLTGDNRQTAEIIGEDLAIDHIYSELLPTEKVEKIEEIEAGSKPGSKVLFVGDGINDAPVLARADIGIAMGGIGSDAAIEAADIVIMTDEPSKIATAIKVAAKTKKIVLQNIVFALGVKLIILLLGALGYATMWEAVFGDVGVALIAVLNAMRCMSIKE